MAGDIGWVDITVGDAEALRDFYSAVVGWTPEAVDMGDYSDFSMLDAGGTARAGVCHARGGNADMPPVWIVYFTVDDVDASIAAAEAAGGTVVNGPRGAGGGRFAVIRDPAGAVCALFQPPT